MKVYALILLGQETVKVEVMAIASGWAMVRRSGAIPFVVSINELTNIKSGKSYV